MNRLRYYRKQRGYTIQYMAKHTGVSEATYRAYETGASRIKDDKLLKIKDLLGVSIDTLLLPEPAPGEQAQDTQTDVIAAMRASYQLTDSEIDTIARFLAMSPKERGLLEKSINIVLDFACNQKRGKTV